MTTPTTSSSRVWITPQARDRLEAELAELQREVDEEMEAAERDDQMLETMAARKARIRQIHELLSNAIVGDTPPDDGVAEPGMVLTVRYDDDETETFLLGVPGAEVADIEVYSTQSPLGAALVGARPGEQRTYELPNGSMQAVTLLSAVPYGAHTTDD